MLKLEDLPKEQLQAVMQSEAWGVDIDSEFLGFIEVYEALSLIIPKHFVVVDLGCGYNAQSFCFKDHKQVIAVDLPDTWYKTVRFKSDNCKLVISTIEQFIKDWKDNLDMDETFAICSYVPPWHGDNIKMVREAFKNVFTFYPSNKKQSEAINNSMIRSYHESF